MKNYINLAFLLCLSVVAKGQDDKGSSIPNNLKIGYISYAYVLDKLPEKKAIDNEVSVQKAQFEEIFQQKVKEYKEKQESYEKATKQNVSDAILKNKVQELQSIESSIQSLQSNADIELQRIVSTKIRPLREKIKVVAQQVAKENGFLYVFRSDYEPQSGESRSILLYSEDKSNDLTDKVLSKMVVNARGQVSPK